MLFRSSITLVASITLLERSCLELVAPALGAMSKRKDMLLTESDTLQVLQECLLVCDSSLSKVCTDIDANVCHPDTGCGHIPEGRL